ncbi:hypothetical protein GCM10020000_42920 [Streptomyces olivoverticillatus]
MACATPGYDGPAWGPGCGAGGEEEPGGWDGGRRLGGAAARRRLGGRLGRGGGTGRRGGPCRGPRPASRAYPACPHARRLSEAAGAVEGDAEGVPE